MVQVTQRNTPLHLEIQPRSNYPTTVVKYCLVLEYKIVQPMDPRYHTQSSAVLTRSHRRTQQVNETTEYSASHARPPIRATYGIEMRVEAREREEIIRTEAMVKKSSCSLPFSSLRLAATQNPRRHRHLPHEKFNASSSTSATSRGSKTRVERHRSSAIENYCIRMEIERSRL